MGEEDPVHFIGYRKMDFGTVLHNLGSAEAVFD